MDRNWKKYNFNPDCLRSLSARRAWIEIVMIIILHKPLCVALRKESVDRNHTVQIIIVKMHASLSARRAWIEIITPTKTLTGCAVALRKESVDRNR